MVATEREIDFSDRAIGDDLRPGLNYEDGYHPGWQKTEATAGSGGGVALYDLWNKRPELQHIHQWAKSRRGSPWCVLTVVMTRVLVQVPHYVITPAVVGGVGALNLMVNLTGRSGAGKGVARSIAEEAVNVGHVKTRPLGTGEGVCRLLAVPDGKKHSEAVLIDGGEVDVVMALKARQGSTLTGVLRNAFSGGGVGFSNAKGDTTVHVAAHSYRFGLVMDVQPEQAGPLLDEAGGGTPQRFLWMPARDRMDKDKPECPPPAIWQAPEWPTRRAGERFVEFPVDGRVLEAIDDGVVARSNDDDNPLDAHAGSVQLRVAVAFALLAGRFKVTWGDWMLARVVMAESDNMRREVQEVLRIARIKDAKNRGKEFAITRQASRDEEEAIRQAGVERCQRTLRRHLTDAWMSRSRFMKDHVAGRLRQYLDEAIAAEVDAKRLETRPAKQGGVLMRLLDLG